MPTSTNAADTIRILVATDNHVGYNERDHIRGDDSWKAFHEVMSLAKQHDVDMVLLAGDLFHDNKPSRKSMYQVMRSLRMTCYGEKPCELEMLSDGSDNFGGAFNHVNYEDPDINVAIPVFSIHGNHDDPSGEGHLAALDILQISGLMNYYGRTPESDNILIKPVLLQKGHTKLALYGMSNVRDERLYRTFRDGKVKFFQPNTQKENWFNLMSVHQNHHAYTDSGYLPENFLPEFLDLVIWGHEHECLIDPRYNPEMSFHVMQPGSSVATSLVPGEAKPKHVALLKITGKKFECETIRLKSVRPFVMKEIVLKDDPRIAKVAKSSDNRQEVTRYLENIVNNLIDEAKRGWLEVQDDIEGEGSETPLPLVRLRVDYTPPENGHFDCENPQRFSNRFVGKVANVNDVVQFHRKKQLTRNAKATTEMPDESVIEQMALDTVKVEKLVREFLTAQSLTILPQNSFGDAVSQFVDKDDKHAMEQFVATSLEKQIEHLATIGGSDEEDEIATAMEECRSKLEELFAAGELKRQSKAKLKPKPINWDSDQDGEWADQPGAIEASDLEDEDQVEPEQEMNIAPAPPKSMAGRGRGRGRGGSTRSGRNAQTSTRKLAATSRGRANGSRAKQRSLEQDSDMEDPEIVQLDGEDDDSDVPMTRKTSRSAAKTTNKRPLPSQKTQNTRQSTLDFSQAMSQSSKTHGGRRDYQELSDDIVSDDDDDAFEPVQTTKPLRNRR